MPLAVARELVGEGFCSPQCLLALLPESDCQCRCDGRGHGLLADAEVDFDTQGVTPVPPMRKAPALICAGCNRPIGKKRLHLVAETDQGNRVVGGCCLGSTTRPLHRSLWPSCPELWHDVYDHSSSSGTRAGVAALLGLWP